MSGVLAVAAIRFRAGWAGRLAWLVPLAFVVGLATRWWADAPSPEQSAAQADRIVLTSVTFAALLVAAVPLALGLPRAIRTGSANTLLAAPVSRLAVVTGEVLGGGTFASLLAVGMLLAGLLGVEAAGHGGAQRDAVRASRSILAAGEAVPELSRAAPRVVVPFTVPDDLPAGAPLRIRITPRLVHQGGDFPFEETCRLGIGRPGQAVAQVDASFGLNVAFDIDLPLEGVRPGDPAELVVEGGTGSWRIRLTRVEAAGAPRSFLVQSLLGVGCLVPLLFAVGAFALVGAVRFGAPTAAGFVLAAVLLFAAQDILLQSSRYVIHAGAAGRTTVHDRDEHGHDHGPVRVSPTQVALARGLLGVLSVVPRLDVFDRTEGLVARRALAADDVGRAARAGLPPLAAALLLSWLLFRGREMIPR